MWLFVFHGCEVLQNVDGILFWRILPYCCRYGISQMLYFCHKKVQYYLIFGLFSMWNIVTKALFLVKAKICLKRLFYLLFVNLSFIYF